MRHPEDLPESLGWLLALIVLLITWLLHTLFIQWPWSHIGGIGVGGALAACIVHWWRGLDEPSR